MDASGIVIIGSYFSPFVRKVLVGLGLKAINYRIDPIAPFFGNDEFTRLNPRRQIPVLMRGSQVVCGSADICAWLESEYPMPPLLLNSTEMREKALSWQAFSDRQLADVLVYGLVQEIIIHPFFFGRPRNDERIRELTERVIPAELNCLEAEIPDKGFLLGEFSLADIAIASMFRTAELVRFSVDAERWPRIAAWLQRTWALPAFAELRPFEQICTRTPYLQQREALKLAGAPLTGTTLGTNTPRPPPAR